MRLQNVAICLQYVTIIIQIHHQVLQTAQISLTLSFSLHPSLSSIAPGRSSKLHPVSVPVQSWCKYVLAGRPTLARPCVASLEKHHKWVRHCFSSCVPHVLFDLLGWYLRQDDSGRSAVVWWEWGLPCYNTFSMLHYDYNMLENAYNMITIC